MCQLLGLSFNKEIQPLVPFVALLENSILHPHGWGIAFYPNKSNQSVLFKEAHPGYNSQLAHFLLTYRYFRSQTFVAHIRKATNGSMSHDNTHPFCRCSQGSEFVFAHNGTLSKPKRLKQLYFQPIGDTDSERAFCYLLTQLRRHEIKRVRRSDVNGYSDADFHVIHKILQDINVIAAGSFNCLFSDGEYLFCYQDLEEARNLFYLKCQKKPFVKRDRKILINKKSAYRQEPVQGYIVATEPSIEGSWVSFTGGQLMVFRHGQLVASLT
jgi:glutamine amidotransferase